MFARYPLFNIAALLCLATFGGAFRSAPTRIGGTLNFVRNGPITLNKPPSAFSAGQMKLKASQLIESVGVLREKLETPPESILRAVENSPAKRRLSVSDAAALAGVDLVKARNGLMTLATLTGGDLEVTNDGDIIYSFPENFRTILAQRSLGQKLSSVYNTLFPFLFFIVRASFGIALLTSLAILASTFIFVYSSSSSSRSDDDDNNRGNQRRSASFSMGAFDGVFDYFYFRPTYGYYTGVDYAPRYDGYESSAPTGRISFIESFFSYVFGDGNPNKEFSSAQLNAIALAIRENKGVVIAEQLAPFMDPPSPPDAQTITSGKESAVVDESWVLPAVLQLGGSPAVTPDGDIVYQFQDLVTSAIDRPTQSSSSSYSSSSNLMTRAPHVLQELTVPFTAAVGWQKFLAGALGAANLLGSLKLGSILATPALFRGEPLLYAGLTKLYPFLLTYAVAYNVIPLVRWAILRKRNEQTEQRNARRKVWQSIISAAAARGGTQLTARVDGNYTPLVDRLSKKLASARAFGLQSTQPKTIGGDSSQIAYSTKQRPVVSANGDDEKDQLAATEEEVLKQFDRKLGEKM